MERITISIDDELAGKFDTWLGAHGYANRSEAVRDLLRARFENELQSVDDAAHCVACLSYVFAYHQRDLSERLIRAQHEQHDLTVSAMRTHLDHSHCLEAVILRGPMQQVREFSDRVCAERGVHHGKLNVIGVELHERHTHRRRGEAHTHLKPRV